MPLLGWLDASRLDADALLKSAGLTRKDLDNPEQRVPREIVGDVWRAAVALTGDAALGLRVAMQMQPGMLGLIEYAARNGASLGQALHTLTRYSELLAEGVHFALHEEGEQVRLSYTVTGSPQPPSVIDFALGYVARVMRDFSQPSVQLSEVSFDHPAPSERAVYEEAFRARLRFDAGHNALSFSSAYLSAQIHSADPHLHAVLDHQAAKLVSELPKADAFEDRVKLLITNELRGGDASAQGLAKKLHMSARTFQRRLVDVGTTHSALLDEVRHALATRMLDQDELSLGEIAEALGFSDVSAFRKAFRRWTGAAPQRRRS